MSVPAHASLRLDDANWLNDDLIAARDVQRRLLAQEHVCFGDLSVDTYYRPFNTIGGDYYNFVPLDRSRLGFAVGDVAGKGVSAALLMAALHASLRACLIDQRTTPAVLMRRLNRLLYESSLPYSYATLFYGEYNAQDRVLTYLNAGHPPPLVLRNEEGRVKVFKLESTGPPIGVFPDAVYKAQHQALESGDLFVGYTDGIIEGAGEEEQWDSTRLEEVVSKCFGAPVTEIIRAVLRARRASLGSISADDMTLVVASLEEGRRQESLEIDAEQRLGP